ncbi:hypothetical protein B0T24DRAFT_679302 [Lasiosphaeria ovina]|uniref:Uncharacterized protein n=1 Tax=Lasiosphaeria ovina TaxID=92902 RepID=A0AAE0N7T7_9PEZI|nr:hypothetical protein B0T24DRAFT_679302 [Lasiosphaeria ovina]
MGSDFTYSQVYKTNPNPYDQIIVLSQKTINDELFNMWAVAPDDSPLLSYTLNLRDGQSLSSQLDAPVISLQVNNQESVQLYYYLKMLSGTLKLYVSNDPADMDMKEFDTTDWSIAIPVKISRKVINKGDDEWKYYADKTGFKNDVFSIAQLYIDASTSAIYDLKRSTFNGLDWSKETAATQANFGTFMSQWMSVTSSGATNVIGAILQGDPSSTLNTNAPSFVPTSIDYYNYAWHNPGSDPNGTGAKVDDIDENALCYLTMSDFASPPEPVGFSFSGTFVDDSAVLCMNARLFWDLWMLPLFKKVNQELELVALEPYLEPSQTAGWDMDCGPNFTFGSNSAHTSDTDPYFDFSSDLLWAGSDIDSPEASCTGNLGDVAKAYDTATTSTSLSYDLGGQKISIQGTSTFFFKVYFPDSYANSTMTLTSNRHLDFALGAVTDGGLDITRYDDGTPAVVTTHESHDAGIAWMVDYETYVEEIDEWITSYLDENISWLTDDLSAALANQHKLFLPGSGIFLMSDAKFNARGDLLATLAYNGAPSPIVRSKIPAARLSLLARDYVESELAVDHGGVDWVPKAWAELKLPKRQQPRHDKPKAAKLPPLKLPRFTVGKK